MIGITAWHVAKYVAAAVLGWVVVWKLVYWLTGFSIGFITLHKGPQITSIRIRLPDVYVYAGFFKIKLWGKNKRIVLSGIRVHIKDDISSGHQLDISKTSQKSPQDKSRSRLVDESFRLCTSSGWRRALFEFALRNITSFNIEIKDAAVTFGPGHCVSVQNLRFCATSCRESLLSVNQKITSNIIVTHSKGLLVSGEQFALMEDLKVSLSCSISRDEFLLSNVNTQVSMSGLNVQAFAMIGAVVPSSASSPKSEPSETKSYLRFFEISHVLQSIITDTSFHFENLVVCDIPFVSIVDHNGVTLPLNYFGSAERPSTCLDVEVKSVTVNLNRLFQGSAGFGLLFGRKSDVPFHLLVSLQLMTINSSRDVPDSSGSLIRSASEVFNLPHFSFTSKSNVSNRLYQGLGFKDCVMEWFLTISNPIIDLSINELNDLIYNGVLLKKFLLMKKLGHAQPSCEDTSSPPESGTDLDEKSLSSLSEDSQLSKLRVRLVGLLLEFYPRLDLKLIVELPRFILHHDLAAGPHRSVNFSLSQIDVVAFTTKERGYDTRLRFLHPRFSFLSKVPASAAVNAAKSAECPIDFDVFHGDHINFRIEFLPNLQFKASSDIQQVACDLSKLDVLKGVCFLMSETAGLLERGYAVGTYNAWLNEKLIDLRNAMLKGDIHQIQSARSTQSIDQLILKALPPWLVAIKVTINGLELKVGARSVLIPRKSVSLQETDILDADYAGDLSGLRHVKYVLETLTVILDDGVSPIDDDSLSISGATIHSSSTERNCTSFWGITLKIEKLRAVTLTRLTKQTQDLLIDIPTVQATFGALADPMALDIEVDIGNIKLTYDKYKLIVLLGSVYLMRELVVNPLRRMIKHMKSDLQKVSMEEKIHPDPSALQQSLMDILNVKVKVAQMDIRALLNDCFLLRLQIMQAGVAMERGVTTVSLDFARLLTLSPIVKGKWSRIVCIDNLIAKIAEPKSDALVQVSTKSIRIMQPHRMIVHELFDNIAIDAKVVKFLVASIGKQINDEDTTIKVIEKPPIKLPSMRVKSKKILFAMEDDPFEAELGMIYQLGLVESKKRAEMKALFKIRSKDIPKSEVAEKSDQLHRLISSSWIRKVRIYKQRLKDEILKHKEFILGYEATLPSGQNRDVVAYHSFAPLLLVIMKKVSIDLQMPEFSMETIPDFIHKWGQGVPKETKYSTLVPMNFSLKLNELRVHLRDYPLPILHITENRTQKHLVAHSLSMSGALVVAEALVLSEKHLRNIELKLAQDVEEQRLLKFYQVTLQKSLASIKLYADVSCEFTSQDSCRFVWGQSYQFGMMQAMANFDLFSKPPLDPSAKLGIWDKVRYVTHGKFQIKTKNKLEIAFKGSRDPYDLFETAAGFVLSFQRDVDLIVNKNDDQDRFFDVKSEYISWYIPNYLRSYLYPWTRDCSQAVYMPHSDFFVTTCFGYYLDDHQDTESEFETSILEKNTVGLNGGIGFTVGFVLERRDKKGEITTRCKPHYEIDLCNPKFTKEGHDSYVGFRSGYIHMKIAMHANNNDSYNSIHTTPVAVRQLIKWWLLFQGNMSLPVRQGTLWGEPMESPKFSQHLFTHKFEFNLSSLYVSHVYRDEETKADSGKIECVGIRAKMDSLVISLRQRKEPRILVHEALSRQKKIMKMNMYFAYVNITNIDMRTVFATFDQDLYHPVVDDGNKIRSKDNLSEDDKQWLDTLDYEEAFAPSIARCSREIGIYHLMYSKRFLQYRNTTADTPEDPDGEIFDTDANAEVDNEEIFEPQIELLSQRIDTLTDGLKTLKKDSVATDQIHSRIDFLNEEVSQIRSLQQQSQKHDDSKTITSQKDEVEFRDKFILINMFLKWNHLNRNYLLKIIHLAQVQGNLYKYLSYDSISALRKFIDSRSLDIDSDDNSVAKSDQNEVRGTDDVSISSEKIWGNFEKMLQQVSQQEQLSRDFLIEIISPQIQLQSDAEPDSVILVTAPSIHGKIVSVLSASSSKMQENILEFETRYGALLEHASVFVLHKDSAGAALDAFVFEDVSYGSEENWPPWLGIEICKNGHWAGEDTILVQELMLTLIYRDVKPLGSRSVKQAGEDDDLTSSAENSLSREDMASYANELKIDCPKLIITCTSEQYLTLYMICLSLLLYSEPRSRELQNKLEKLMFSIDLQDLSALHTRMVHLYRYYQLSCFLNRNYSFRQQHMSNENLNDYLTLKSEREKYALEIYLIMDSILSGDTNPYSAKRPQTVFSIRADEIIIHMLDEDRSPLLDIAMAEGRYKRIVNEDGTNENKIEIKMMQGFNLLPDSVYQEFLTPLKSPDKPITSEGDLIVVDWAMDRPIGGIKVIEWLEVRAQPLSIQIDGLFGLKLTRFIFGSDNISVEDSALGELTRKLEDREGGSGSGSEENSDDELLYANVTQSTHHTSKSVGASVLLKSTNTDEKSVKLHPGMSLASTEAESIYADRVEEMLERSKNNYSIGHLKIEQIVLLVSIKVHEGYMRLLNVQDFVIKLPEFTIEQRVVSFQDITSDLQKIVTKQLFSHLGRLVKSKVKRRARNRPVRPINPLKRYTLFTRVNELMVVDSRSKEKQIKPASKTRKV